MLFNVINVLYSYFGTCNKCLVRIQYNFIEYRLLGGGGVMSIEYCVNVLIV